MTTLYKPLNALVTNCVPACAFSPPHPAPGPAPLPPRPGQPTPRAHPASLRANFNAGRDGGTRRRHKIINFFMLTLALL